MLLLFSQWVNHFQYTAIVKDNNTFITCLATQLDHNGKDVLYETRARLILHIEEMVQPLSPTDDALTQNISIISGVVLSVLFLALVIIFVVLVVCKRRRTLLRSASNQNTEDTSQETSSSFYKPVWSTDCSVVSTTPILKNKVTKEIETPQRRKMKPRLLCSFGLNNKRFSASHGSISERRSSLLSSSLSFFKGQEHNKQQGKWI